MRALVIVVLLAIAPQQFQEGVFEVTVLDSTGEAVPAARVSLTLGPAYEPFIVTPAFTDNKGRATFKGLHYGVYEIQIEREGYQLIALGENGRVFIRQEVPNAKLKAYLNRVATISGRVLNANGDPIPNAEVTPLTVRYRLGQRTLGPASDNASAFRRVSSTTNDRGEYRIPNLLAGEYYLRIENAVDLKPGESTDNVMKGTYYPGVHGQRRAIPVVMRGQDLSGVDIKMPTGPLFKISGTLVNPFRGRLLANGDEQVARRASFHLASADPETIEDPVALWVPYKLSAERESPFEIRGVAPGEYFLYLLFDTPQGFATARTLVSVDGKDVEGLRVVLKAMPQMKGRVVITDGNAASHAGEIQWDNVRVGGLAKDRLPQLLWFPAGVSVDPKTHEFLLENLTENVRFGLRIDGLPPDAYVTDLRQGGVSVFNEGTIRATAEAEIEVVVGLRGSIVEGVVRNTSRDIVGQAGVALVPSFPRRGNAQLYKRMLTDAEGRFSFRGVAPGDYKVFAWPTLPSGQAEEAEQYLAPYDALGTAVRVTAGVSINVRVTLIPFLR